MKLSVSFFGSGQDGSSARARYDTVLALGGLADRFGFHAVWVPERHFQDFGDIFPNPAVLGAALAATTSRVRIHAGSVVLPLHNPIRLLEDWSMLDAMSGGRIGVSAATGWHPLDFIIAPADFAGRREKAAAMLADLRSAWRDGVVHAADPDGAQRQVRVRPERVQPELPVWLTTSGRPQTWTAAGEAGVSVLASTIGQTAASLADNANRYRHCFDYTRGTQPWITLVVHTYVGDDDDTDRQDVRRRVEEPMKRYLASFLRQQASAADGAASELDAAAQADLLDFAFERYWSSMSMFGTTRHCAETLAELTALGCDEVACLVDFGPPRAELERTMTRLAELIERS